MISEKQYKMRGIALLGSFFVILIMIFMPIFGGQNGLDYMDSLFNSLSKGSAYYIDKLQKDLEQYAGQQVDQTVTMPSPKQAAIAATMINASGATATATDAKLAIKGEYNAIMSAMLADADAMYKNNGEAITAKYQLEPREAVNGWWLLLSAMQKELTKKERFDLAKTVNNFMTKGVEPAYNYYGVEAKSVKAGAILIVLALGFYVIYTMWYGFGLLYLFEGLGIKLEH